MAKREIKHELPQMVIEVKKSLQHYHLLSKLAFLWGWHREISIDVLIHNSSRKIKKHLAPTVTCRLLQSCLTRSLSHPFWNYMLKSKSDPFPNFRSKAMVKTFINKSDKTTFPIQHPSNLGSWKKKHIRICQNSHFLRGIFFVGICCWNPGRFDHQIKPGSSQQNKKKTPKSFLRSLFFANIHKHLRQIV